MKRRFIIMTEAITPDQENQFKSELAIAHWWHWLPNAWLIVDLSHRLDVNKINAAFAKIAPMAQCLVFEVDVKAWNSMERKTQHGTLSDWVKTTFMPP